MPEPPRRASAALRCTGDGAPRWSPPGAGRSPTRSSRARARRACPCARTRSSPTALAALALGDEVPEELWTAVAEVLAWAYRLRFPCNYPKGVMQEVGVEGPIQALSVRPAPSKEHPVP